MILRRVLSILPAMLFGLVLPAASSGQDIGALENRLAEIDRQLDDLATFSMQTSVGAIGFRSRTHAKADHTEWIRIDLAEESNIDLVVLVPAIWRETGAGFVADGFPLDFELLAGSSSYPEGRSIARFTEKQGLLPRVAPLTISCTGTRASWVKLVVTRLSPRAWDNAHVLQLSEMMLFSGEENLALNQTVTTSSDDIQVDFGARRKNFLVDGSVPFLMNAGTGEPSQAYLAEVPANITASFTADLGASLPINRLRIHTLEVADTVPQASRSDFGTPRRLTLEGANQPDFSDAIELCVYHKRSIYEAAPIIQLPFDEASSRYLRFTINEADQAQPFEFNTASDFFAFAEIEVLSKGKNILLDRPLTLGFTPISAERPLADLTDGRNIFGSILPTRAWMEQLALRHDLETERPVVEASLGGLYAEQKKDIELLKVLAVILTSGLLILILIGRIRNMRTVDRLRKRFAADLHDEIGANLHAVSLLSDIAREQTDKQPDHSGLVETVTEIRAVADRTAGAVRYLSDSQNTRKPLGTLEEDMHRIAARMMDETTYKITVDGNDHIAKLAPRTRADLFLYYKECLVNISRHSGASHFSADVLAGAGQLSMIIEDNGSGLHPISPPPSLQRRAKILRARLKVESPPPDAPQGTRITLTLHPRRFSFLP